jgi:DNA-binding transcriptional MerR regulator
VRNASYKLEELARAAGISPRTVRYYVQRGLLAAPAFKGKDTAYGPDHLVRLRTIRRLQDAFFPLDVIAVELERLSPEEIEKVADGGEIPRGGIHVEGRVQAVAPSPSSTTRQSVGRVLRRFELAPGIELSIADDATPDAMAIAEEILSRLGTK